SVNVNGNYLIERIWRIIQWMLKKMSKIHPVWPKVTADEVRNKISKPINRTNLASTTGAIKLCYCSQLTAVIVVSITKNIVKIRNHSWKKIGVIRFEKEQCVTS